MRGSGRHNEEERWDEGKKGGGWIEGARHYGISLIASNRPRIVPHPRGIAGPDQDCLIVLITPVAPTSHTRKPRVN